MTFVSDLSKTNPSPPEKGLVGMAWLDLGEAATDVMARGIVTARATADLPPPRLKSTKERKTGVRSESSIAGVDMAS